MKVHREPRDFPVYILAVGKDVPKLKLSGDQGAASVMPAAASQRDGVQTPFGVIPADRQNVPSFPRRGMIRRTGDEITATGVRLSFLASFLAQQLGRPVLDKTGLEGLFDFKLHWIPAPIIPSESRPPDPTLHFHR